MDGLVKILDAAGRTIHSLEGEVAALRQRVAELEAELAKYAEKK